MGYTSEPRPLKVAVIREELIVLTKDLEKAVLLNQLLYWTRRSHDFDEMLEEESAFQTEEGKELLRTLPRCGWIFKSSEDLLLETMLSCSSSSVRRKLKEMVESGRLEERANPYNNWDKRRQFRCNLKTLQENLNKLGYVLPGFTLSFQKPQKSALCTEESSQEERDAQEGVTPGHFAYNLPNTPQNSNKTAYVSPAQSITQNEQSNAQIAQSIAHGAQSLKRD